MNENELLDMIKDEALGDAPEPDFDDVLKRIESEKMNGETQESRNGKKRGFSQAAAVIAVIAIGTAAVFGTALLTDRAQNSVNDRAETMAIVTKSAEEESVPLTEEETAAAPVPAPDEADMDAEKSADASFDALPQVEAAAQNGAGETFAANDAATADAGEAETAISPTDAAEQSYELEALTQYHVDKLKMDISVPERAYCTSDNVPSNFPPLEHFGLSAEQLETNYRKRGICFNALWFEDGFDAVEVVVSHEDISDWVNNLSSIDDYEVEKLRQTFLSYGSDQPNAPRYSDVTVVERGKLRFIRAVGTDAAGRAAHVQYMTIVNGDCIRATLIEHYPEGTDMNGVSASGYHEALMDGIAGSISFDKVRGEFAYKISKLKAPVWLSLIGLLILGGFGIDSLIKKKKKQQAALNAHGDDTAAVSLPEDDYDADESEPDAEETTEDSEDDGAGDDVPESSEITDK